MAGHIHELLDDREKNYESWSKSMKDHLIANDLWGIIEGTLELQTGDDEENYKTWQRINAQVLQTISSACESDHLARKVLEFESGKEAWDYLEMALGTLEEPTEVAIYGPDNTLYSRIIENLRKNDWKAIKGILDKNPELMREQISTQGRTLLHVAVAAGKLLIVEKLLTLEYMLKEDLEVKDAHGFTALAIAAQNGCHEIANLLLSKNALLIKLKTNSGVLPVVLASAAGHADLTRYLYNYTDPQCFDQESDECRNGATLVTNCIIADICGKKD